MALWKDYAQFLRAIYVGVKLSAREAFWEKLISYMIKVIHDISWSCISEWQGVEKVMLINRQKTVTFGKNSLLQIFAIPAVPADLL